MQIKDITRKAGVIWNGDLENGQGFMSTESKALFEDDLRANPEELIAAAHAACYSMSLADLLRKAGFHPRKTDTNATCTMAANNGSYEITSMKLHVRAEVHEIDDQTFQKLVREAGEHSPVSNLLRRGLEIELDATLDYT